MVKKIDDIISVFLLSGLGVLAFLAPVKFGIAAELLPKNIFQWFMFSWPIGVFEVLLLVLFSVWCIRVLFFKEVRIKYSVVNIPSLIFIITAFVSVFTACERHLAHICFSRILSYFIFYFLTLNILKSKKDFNIIFLVIVVSSVYIAFYGIYQYFVGLPEARAFAKVYFCEGLDPLLQERLLSDRVFSTFIYPNTFTGYLFLTMPVCIGVVVLFLKNKSYKRSLLMTAVVLCMFFVLNLTFHRGHGAVGKVKGTSVNRLEYWKAGMEMIKENPVKGIGLDNFGTVYLKYKIDIAEETMYAHNNFLQIWAEQGVLGFLSFCMIWFAMFWNGLKVLRKIKSMDIYPLAVGVFAGLCFFILHNLIDFDWYIPGLPLTAFVLLGVFVNATGMFKEKIFIVKNIWVRVFFISIIIFGFIFGFVNLGRDTLSGSYLEESEIAFKNKNIDAAENLCNASIRLDNDNAGVYFLLGKIHIAKKDYLKAISCFKSAVKHNSFCSVFYYELAMSYLNWMHKSNDLSVCRYAGDAFMKAVEFYPSNSFYRLQLAQFYELNNQPGSAVVEYENCIGLNKKVQEEQDKYPAKLLKNLILSPEIIIQVEDRIKSITSLSK